MTPKPAHRLHPASPDPQHAFDLQDDALSYDADQLDWPEPRRLQGALGDIFDALVSSLQDTRLEPDLEPLLWSTVNLFHQAAAKLERALDANEQAQRRSQLEQDGSEIRSVELEGLLAQGQDLLERRGVFETLRDQASDLFALHLGSAWRPHAGSKVNRQTLTAAVIDSRDFLAARQRADLAVMIPAGPKIAFTGGLDFNDYSLIWEALDRVRAKHPDMVLLHGGATKGAERIAACWADSRKVTQIAFKPDWTHHGRSAPFKRNDQMIQTLPLGVVVFPGSGISDNLADKARKLGVPLFDFRKRGGG